MTLAIGASKAGYPEYQQGQGLGQGLQGPQQQGAAGYLQQAPPYEQHRHHLLQHHQPPSSPSSSASNCCSTRCCPSTSTSPSSGSASSSRRGSSEEADGSVAWYCCCCCTSPRAARKRRSVLASVGVCVLVLVYTLLGAFAFTALEGSSRAPPPAPPVTRAVAPAHDDLRTKTVEKLWSITEDLNILYKDNWTRLAAQEVLRFQDMLVEKIKNGAALNGVVAPPAEQGKTKTATVTTAASTYQGSPHRWTFPSSFLYSLTLITTIGESRN